MKTVILAAILSVTLPLAFAQNPVGVPDPAAAMQKLGSQVNWVADDPQLLAEGNRTRQGALELRASSKKHKNFDRLGALAEARARARTSKQLIMWYIPSITGRQMYRPALPDLYMRAVAFTDPECVDIINRRFVPIRLICDKKLQEASGITAPEMVEPAIVFLKPDGAIVHRVDRIRTFNALWFMQLFRDVLAKNKAFASSTTIAGDAAAASKKTDPRLPHAEKVLREGHWETAEPLLAKAARELKDSSRVRAGLLLARVQWRLGQSGAALNTLDETEKRIPKPAARSGRRRARPSPLLNDIACARGRIHLQSGDLPAAHAAFTACKRGPRRAECTAR